MRLACEQGRTIITLQQVRIRPHHTFVPGLCRSRVTQLKSWPPGSAENFRQSMYRRCVKALHCEFSCLPWPDRVKSSARSWAWKLLLGGIWGSQESHRYMTFMYTPLLIIHSIQVLSPLGAQLKLIRVFVILTGSGANTWVVQPYHRGTRSVISKGWRGVVTTACS